MAEWAQFWGLLVSLWDRFITGVQEGNFANVCGMYDYHIEQQEAPSGIGEEITEGVIVLSPP